MQKEWKEKMETHRIKNMTSVNMVTLIEEAEGEKPRVLKKTRTLFLTASMGFTHMTMMILMTLSESMFIITHQSIVTTPNILGLVI